MSVARTDISSVSTKEGAGLKHLGTDLVGSGAMVMMAGNSGVASMMTGDSGMASMIAEDSGTPVMMAEGYLWRP